MNRKTRDQFVSAVLFVCSILGAFVGIKEGFDLYILIMAAAFLFLGVLFYKRSKTYRS